MDGRLVQLLSVLQLSPRTLVLLIFLAATILSTTPSTVSSAKVDEGIAQSVTFEDAHGKLKDLPLGDLRAKLKSNERVARRLSEGEEESNTININAVEKEDPELAFYIRIAQFGAKSLQAQGYAEGKELVGFTDAMDKIPERRTDRNRMEINLRMGKIRRNKDTESRSPTASAEKNKEEEEEEVFYLAFHGDKYLYQGGVAITEAWQLDKTGKKRVSSIELPKPPKPFWRRPQVWILVCGVLLVLLGTAILCCVQGKTNQSGQDTKLDLTAKKQN